jgi:dienelactone hydrolase
VLEGDLSTVNRPVGVIVFAHGSGSSRHSPRNQAVAEHLQEAGLSTLLLDLLTPREDTLDARTGDFRFNVGLLAGRVISAVEWLAEQPALGAMPVGLFGASTGAAAALIASAHPPRGRVKAVVSRGGRPDLADDVLTRVDAPTLLIVGGRDEVVTRLNRQALDRMVCESRLEIVPGATHLFEEPGALRRVALLAAEWFVDHLRDPAHNA